MLCRTLRHVMLADTSVGIVQYIAIPVRHMLPPSHHPTQSPVPPQHHAPSPSPPGPNPRPLKRLTGTGSNSHIPHLAKSSASSGPVRYNHTTTKPKFAVWRMTFGKGNFDRGVETAVYRMQPNAWVRKKKSGPESGLDGLRENVVDEAEAWMEPERKKATPSWMRRAGTPRGDRLSVVMSRRDGSEMPKRNI